MWDSPLDLQLNTARPSIDMLLLQVRRASQLELFHLNRYCQSCLLLRLCAGMANPSRCSPPPFLPHKHGSLPLYLYACSSRGRSSVQSSPVISPLHAFSLRGWSSPWASFGYGFLLKVPARSRVRVFSNSCKSRTDAHSAQQKVVLGSCAPRCSELEQPTPEPPER